MNGYEKLAKKYGISAERIRQEWMAFQDSEGFLERAGRVTECQTFDEWLSLVLSSGQSQTREPFHKGDHDYGL